MRYDFLLRGLDTEDAEYLRRRYEGLLQLDIPQTNWLNNTHWVDHPRLVRGGGVVGREGVWGGRRRRKGRGG